jgi:hypothetical protein
LTIDVIYPGNQLFNLKRALSVYHQSIQRVKHEYHS